MKSLNRKILIGLALVVISTLIYYFHFLLFHDEHHIFIYFIGDVAFLPIEVLLVSLVIENILNRREKKEKLEKLNMVIETFFSEFGKDLLSDFSRIDKNIDKIRNLLIIDDCNTNIDFKLINNTIAKFKADINIREFNLKELRDYLKSKRHFLLNLLQNPNLLEHEHFTETLMSIFHITEELAARNIDTMTEDDLLHTKDDLERAYHHLILQWIKYIEYIQKHYPYFFLFAVNTNPFNKVKKTV
jgi:hypothetical protein